MWGHGVLPAALAALFSTTLSLALLVYLCANVGPQSLLVVRLTAPFVPHSASLGPDMARQVHSAPAAGLRPSHRSGWRFIFLSPWFRTSLLLDYLSVLFVRGSATCLPTPPSWFSYIPSLKKYEVFKIQCVFSIYRTSQFGLTSFQVLDARMWLVVTSLLDSTDLERYFFCASMTPSVISPKPKLKDHCIQIYQIYIAA